MTGWSESSLRSVLDPVPDAWDHRPGLRKAAVLVPWYREANRDWLLFTRRRDDLPQHPGQIAFPGGMKEGDESPGDCALRESHEEVGLPPEQVVVLGSIPPRLSIGGFWVHVIVGRIPADLELVPDPREVAAIVPLPVDLLRDRSLWDDRPPATDSTRRAMPHFDHDGETLWGLTARFTLDLLERLD